MFLSTHRDWESFLCRFLQMLSTGATTRVSAVYLKCFLPCSLARTCNFRQYLPSSFLHKLTSIYRQNWSWERIQKSKNNDKATSFSSAVVNRASSLQKVSYSKPLHNKSCCLNTMVFSSLQSHQHLDIRWFSKRLYYETLAKHPVHNSDFVLLHIHRLARWIYNNYSPKWRWLGLDI